MANPPITIGPFNNVPAPGSPIKSDWPQEISAFVNVLAPLGYVWHGTQSSFPTGIGSTLTDLPGAAVAFTADPSRYYLVLGLTPRMFQNGAGEHRFAIRDAANTTLMGNTVTAPAGAALSHFLFNVVSSRTGPQTFKLSMQTMAGTVDTTPGFGAIIVVADIGQRPLPT